MGNDLRKYFELFRWIGKFHFYKTKARQFIHQRHLQLFSLKISPFNFKKWETVMLSTSPPEANGWEPCWHGYWQMKKTRSNKKRERALSEKLYLGSGIIKSYEVEKQCFL